MKRWVWVVVLLVILTVIVGWGMVSLPAIANYSWSIELRKQLYSMIYPKLGLDYKRMPFEIMPTLTVQGEPGYVYTMLGEFVSIDQEEKILYLQTKKGNVYGLRYATLPSGVVSYWEKGEDRFEKVLFSQRPIAVGDQLMVQWSDMRMLTEILSEVKTDKQHSLVNCFLQVKKCPIYYRKSAHFEKRKIKIII